MLTRACMRGERNERGEAEWLQAVEDAGADFNNVTVDLAFLFADLEAIFKEE